MCVTSGNGMGDYGARMLSKALQINTKLQTVVWDKNGVSAQGFEDIADALAKWVFHLEEDNNNNNNNNGHFCSASY